MGSHVKRPVLLVILDGFGLREAAPDNAITLAQAPFWKKLWQDYPHTTLEASERRVGLPRGQMGNSEVGHLNIGAGRVVYQDYTRIEEAIEQGTLSTNPVIVELFDTVKKKASTLHLLGLLSAGGVHSHEAHLYAMIACAIAQGVERIAVHAFLDGRDTPPRSAASSLEALQDVCKRYPNVRVASVIGRYYAMDRDARWDRTETAYQAIVHGVAPFQASTPLEALKHAYDRHENDEFVQATLISDTQGATTTIQEGDAVLFMNFRSDRARQLTQALTDPDFTGFERGVQPSLSSVVCLTSYGKAFAHLPTVFSPQTLEDTLGEVLARQGAKQLRIAETEKYAHVTYFFNGGVEAPYPGEARILVESPKVATYDLAPAMSAEIVTDHLIEAIEARRFDAFICNYANGDMVGHTGRLDAAIQAIEALDRCLARLVPAMQAIGGEVLITADHGNAEMMFDAETQQPHTAHTLNPVPLLYVGRHASMIPGGALEDIAPTVLELMGLPIPAAMTGHSRVVVHE
jgi:2,3-bisphosphoglycerate-independent phosphoglycerate mutase